MWFKFLQKIVQFLNPKLEKYRLHEKKSDLDNPPIEKKLEYTPKNLEDFIDVLKHTPKNILSDSDRKKIASVMSFDDRLVSDLMLPKSEMVFVKRLEILGPLTLDKLYKSGFTIFPVVNEKDKVLGVIHTDALNALEIKDTDRAEKYLDPNFSYLKTSDSLETAVEKIKKTNHYYFLVLDEKDSLAGFFTIEMLLDYFLGEN